MTGYIVQLEWAYESDHGVDTYLFSSQKKAREKFNNLVLREKECSWIADTRIDVNEKGEPISGSLVIKEEADMFSAYIEGYECVSHTYITIKTVTDLSPSITRQKFDEMFNDCKLGSPRHSVAEFIDNSSLLAKYKNKEYYELEDSIVELIKGVVLNIVTIEDDIKEYNPDD